MNKLVKKVGTSIAVVMVSVGTLAGCSNSNNNKKSTQSKTSNIQVTYVLKDSKKTFANKKITLKKHSTVLAGLKKGWKVKENKGFVTSIDGRAQNPSKKIYWTYKLNGKWADAANKVKLNKNDKVVWTRGTVTK